MAKKACKACKFLYDGQKCPACENSQSTDSWKGKIIVINAEKSEIAKKTGIKIKGEYAIKT
jgi:DNA-directed RNA polymerase subunit E"